MSAAITLDTYLRHETKVDTGFKNEDKKITCYQWFKLVDFGPQDRPTLFRYYIVCNGNYYKPGEFTEQPMPEDEYFEACEWFNDLEDAKQCFHLRSRNPFGAPLPPGSTREYYTTTKPLVDWLRNALTSGEISAADVHIALGNAKADDTLGRMFGNDVGSIMHNAAWIPALKIVAEENQ